MDTSEQILVIFLSVALAVLLLLSIVVAVLAIKLLQSIKHITEKAEHIVENVEHVGDTFRNAAGPLALMKVVSNIVRVVTKQSKNKGSNRRK